MDRVGHVNIQEDLEYHGFFNLALYSRYVGLSLISKKILSQLESPKNRINGFVAMGAITRGEEQGDVECLFIYAETRSNSFFAFSSILG